MSGDPFKTYERTKVETKKVAEVTEENIGVIARIVKGQVDYSGATPELIVLSNEKPYRVKVGYQVSLLGSMLVNANGFNHAGDWREVAS